MSTEEERLRLAGVEVIPLGQLRAPRAPTRPSRFLRDVIEALLPEESAGDPDRIERVTHFVHRQLEALPLELRVLLLVGLGGFRAFVVLRYVRGFCGLDAATRRAVVRAWSYGPLPPARQLFRVLRSPALLAWYDLPRSRSQAEPGD